VEAREWLTVKAVAHELRLSAPRVYQLIEEGEIPGVFRTGKRSLRIERREFYEWLESRRISPPANCRQTQREESTNDGDN
jgi:excisionase family DNA binding protein